MESLGRSVNESKVKYLDMNSIPEFTSVQRIAYVHDVSIGMTKMESGFVKFFLKDCNANLTTAILFDVEDFLFSGVNATAFKHKPVIFRCIAQDYKGRLSLVIDGKEGISVYDGDFDFDRFIGREQYSMAALEKCMPEYGIDAELPFSEWASCSIEELSRGKVGAYNRLVELAFGTLEPILNTLPFDEAKKLLTVFITVADYNYQYMKTKRHTDVIGNLGVLPLLNRLSNKMDGDDNKILCQDALSSVAGLNKPKHLYAHLIKNAFENAQQTLCLQTQFNAMPFGAKAYAGGVELSKY